MCVVVCDVAAWIWAAACVDSVGAGAVFDVTVAVGFLAEIEVGMLVFVLVFEFFVGGFG